MVQGEEHKHSLTTDHNPVYTQTDLASISLCLYIRVLVLLIHYTKHAAMVDIMVWCSQYFLPVLYHHNNFLYPFYIPLHTLILSCIAHLSLSLNPNNSEAAIIYGFQHAGSLSSSTSGTVFISVNCTLVRSPIKIHITSWEKNCRHRIPDSQWGIGCDGDFIHNWSALIRELVLCWEDANYTCKLANQQLPKSTF